MANYFTKKIISEKTLGEKLRMLRKRRHLSLEQAEEATKVRAKYLEALESGSYGELPADVYTLGFLVKYAEFLETPKDDLISSYRRERGSSISSRLFSPHARLREKRPLLTPRIVVWGLVLLAIVGILGYIFYAVKNFTSAPNLEIQSPVAESVIRQDAVEVIGKTDQGTSLQINGQTVFLDDKGGFKEQVKLQQGLNNIELRATNRVKKETVKVIKILAEY